MIEINPFKTLGLKYGAPMDKVTKRYRELAKKYHPDINPGHEKEMRLVNEAYDAIKKGDYYSEEEYDAMTGKYREPAKKEEQTQQPMPDMSKFMGRRRKPDEEIWEYRGHYMTKRRALAWQWWDRHGIDFLRYFVVPLVLVILLLCFTHDQALQQKIGKAIASGVISLPQTSFLRSP